MVQSIASCVCAVMWRTRLLLLLSWMLLLLLLLLAVASGVRCVAVTGTHPARRVMIFVRVLCLKVPDNAGLMMMVAGVLIPSSSRPTLRPTARCTILTTNHTSRRWLCAGLIGRRGTMVRIWWGHNVVIVIANVDDRWIADSLNTAYYTTRSSSASTTTTECRTGTSGRTNATSTSTTTLVLWCR
uniref:Uncharacterized protein n=1 Tax=Anopheles darlingi TaxID=43151 RepID=A0A2M4DCD8_ANODA